jgi:hypothetical protein
MDISPEKESVSRLKVNDPCEAEGSPSKFIVVPLRKFIFQVYNSKLKFQFWFALILRKRFIPRGSVSMFTWFSSRPAAEAILRRSDLLR